MSRKGKSKKTKIPIHSTKLEIVRTVIVVLVLLIQTVQLVHLLNIGAL